MQACLTVLLITSGVIADDPVSVWPPDKPVRVGTITHNPPYVIENPSKGIDLDLVTAAFDHVGLKVMFQHAPLSRVQILLETGKVDAMTTFRTTDGLCTNSDVFSHWYDGITVPLATERDVQGVDDLAGLRVGMFPGAVMVLPNLTAAHVESFGRSIVVYNREQLIKMLNYNRLDAYIGDYWALEYAYRQLASERPKPYRVAVAFEPTPRRLCIRDEGLTALFNRGVAAVLASDTPAAVKARYLGKEAAPAEKQQLQVDDTPGP